MKKNEQSFLISVKYWSVVFVIHFMEFVLERRVVCLLDALVVAKMYKNRSDAVQHAVEWFFTKRG